MRGAHRLAQWVERALRFPLVGITAALGIAVVSGRVLFETVASAYYVFYYPPSVRPKDTHHFPPLGYALEQFAILAWCLLGLVSSIVLLRGVILKRDIGVWLVQSLLLFVTVLVVLGLGIVLGDWRPIW